MKPQHATVGSLLRSLRLRNGWTLRQMSERSGIPRSTLTKIEHDRLTLTYDKLALVSQRLNIRMSELLAQFEDEPTSTITARRSVGDVDNAIHVSTPNYDYHYMCPELRRKRMIPVVVRVRAKSRAEFGELIRHSGEEYAYVLEGRIILHTEFYDPIELGAGQSVYIDSNMGHAFTTAENCDEGVMLSVCSSAEESLMEALMTLHNEDARVPPASATGGRAR